MLTHCGINCGTARWVGLGSEACLWGDRSRSPLAGAVLFAHQNASTATARRWYVRDVADDEELSPEERERLLTEAANHIAEASRELFKRLG